MQERKIRNAQKWMYKNCLQKKLIDSLKGHIKKENKL